MSRNSQDPEQIMRESLHGFGDRESPRQLRAQQARSLSPRELYQQQERQSFARGGSVAMKIKEPVCRPQDSYCNTGSKGHNWRGLMGIDEGSTRSSHKQGGSVRIEAQRLRHMGRDGDTDLVHVNEQEKRMLKAMGGRGSINPKTTRIAFK